VQPESFVYPPYDIPLVQAYGGLFESVFVVLHPFVRVPESLAWSVTRQYPADAQIAALGTRFPWTQVATETGLASYARVNQALLTSTGSVVDYLADPSGRNALQAFLQSGSVWMPVEGRFEPLLQSDFLKVFSHANAEELLFVPEFPHTDPAVRLPVAGLEDGSVPFPSCGTLLACDGSFLFTVDWDSFFTLFYGRRDFVAATARALKLEGFFASANTEHAWFNYSFGCATVTISPEDWTTV
jgi:Protein of unknown function (DUF2711)